MTILFVCGQTFEFENGLIRSPVFMLYYIIHAVFFPREIADLGVIGPQSPSSAESVGNRKANGFANQIDSWDNLQNFGEVNVLKI